MAVDPTSPRKMGQMCIVLQSGPPATGLRKPESPKSTGESAGNSVGKKGTAGSSAVSLAFQRKWPPSTAPSGQLLADTVPSTLPGTFGGFRQAAPIASIVSRLERQFAKCRLDT